MNTFDIQGFAAADKEEQNQILDQLRDSGDLFPLVAELLERAETAKPLWLLSAHSSFASLKYAEARQDWTLFRPAFRRLIADYAPFEPDEGRLTVPPLAEEYGLEADLNSSASVSNAIAREAIASGGPAVWQQVMSLTHLADILPDLSDGYINPEPLLGMALEHMLSSRRLLKVVHIWNEVWKRTPLIDSDLYYHDSRLRRAILDQNIDHAYRLVAATIKSGFSAPDVMGHFIKACYDIDFIDPEQMILLPAGMLAVLRRDWDPQSPEFQHAMARFVYDVMHFERSEKDRIEYEKISLIKSREILIDLRKSFLKSVFLQAWGIAEYAFVHGYEAAEILDEIYRVSAAIGEDVEQNALAHMMLWNASELVSILEEEEYSLYVLAYAVRFLVRMPKVRTLLDPFPDELE